MFTNSRPSGVMAIDLAAWLRSSGNPATMLSAGLEGLSVPSGSG